jgi:hypothetical protein
MGKRTGRLPGCENPTSFKAGFSQVILRSQAENLEEIGPAAGPCQGTVTSGPCQGAQLRNGQSVNRWQTGQ